MPEQDFIPADQPWTNPIPENQVFIETGRGTSVPINVGANFVDTVERIAHQSAYGGYYRVFLNGSEIVEPSDAPQTIEDGMRIVLTPYDKVG